jgi:hypothetical protein
LTSIIDFFGDHAKGRSAKARFWGALPLVEEAGHPAEHQKICSIGHSICGRSVACTAGVGTINARHEEI